MTHALFDNPAPRLFTVPPGADFLTSIAETVRSISGAEHDPDALTQVMILVPTRRAGRALGDAFARLAGEGVALLPMIRPIGEFDADDPPFEPGELAGIAPDAITPSHRRFELARLIWEREKAAGSPISLPGALALADPLAALLDDLATEEAGSLDRLQQDIRDHLPLDRQAGIDFLRIVEEFWPARLAELGRIDPAARRTQILRALAERWRKTPPEYPVIAVGSTGSIPAVRDLLAVVAGLPLGAVVLPGLDWDADPAAWSGIDDAHPQWAMKALLGRLKVDRAKIALWPGVEEAKPARARRRVIAEALRPAEATSDWLKRVDNLAKGHGEDYFSSGLDGLSLIEAADQPAEARICALLLREVLEADGKTGILVTPDRNLAHRVAVEMKRFGVELDDSGGTALAASPPAALMARLLSVAEDSGSVLALSSLWSSPLFAMGQARGALHRVMEKVEAEALRGVRPGSDMAAVIARLDHRHAKLFDADKVLARDILTCLDDSLKPLLDGEHHPASVWMEQHVRAAETAAATDKAAGASVLWAGDAGMALAGLVREFLLETELLPPMSFDEYSACFREVLSARRIPPRAGVHPRLQVLGPLEARLIQADRVVLAGLNEGTWPAGIGVDPWLSRGMRDVLELGAPERRHGLAAHDFAQLAASGEVFLTRAEKVDGSPSIASRWIWRLKTLAVGALGKEEAARTLRPAMNYEQIADRLDRPSVPVVPALPPDPRPPVEARPRRMSITEIRTWVRDPYSIYARHVLGLRRLDPPDMRPTARERGSALHQVLEDVLLNWPADQVPGQALADILQAAREQLLAYGFPLEELSIELARVRRAATWLIGWEKKRRASGIRFDQAELWGEWELATDGGPWTLVGRCDRFDRDADGQLHIIDYKTGTTATDKEVAAGFDAQLPLSAAMARHAGVFPGLDPAAPSGLFYVSLPGNNAGGRERRIDTKNTGPAIELADRAVEDLRGWIDRFDNETTAYRSQIRAKYTNDYSDFDHLARRSEWASAPGGDGGEA